MRLTAEHASRIVEDVVREYTHELDSYVRDIRDGINQMRESGGQVSDQDLQRMVLRLPILMYEAFEMLDRASLESDVAKAAVESVRAENYRNAPEGTIPEKKAWATLRTADEVAIVDLAKHVHARIKNRIEAANLLFDAGRKVLTNRDTEKAVFGREQRR